MKQHTLFEILSFWQMQEQEDILYGVTNNPQLSPS